MGEARARNVTVGAAILCDGGKTILLSCDQRASFGDPASVINDSCGKLFSVVDSKLYGIIAGDINTCQMIDGYLAENMKTVKVIGQDTVKIAMQNARTQVCKVLSDERLRSELVISLNQFHTDKTLSLHIRREAQKIIKSTVLGAELIVVGFEKGGGIALAFSGNEVVQETTTLGFHLIGSGAELARCWLNFRKQNVHMGAVRSYYHLREAMLFSALDPHVSTDSVCIAIRPGGMFKLERAKEYMNKIGSRFYVRTTEPLDNTAEIDEFKNAFGISEGWDKQ
jgi:hypothetical protein